MRREIISTVVINSMVNRAGITFGHRLADETGAAIAEITRAFLVARDVFDIHRLWAEIDRLDFKVPVQGQMQLVFETQHLLRHGARWFLRHDRYLRDVTGTVQRFGSGVKAVGGMAGVLPAIEDWDFLGKLNESMREAGIPARTAQRFAQLRLLISALEITRLAEGTGLAVEVTARIYYALGRRLRIHIAHTHANTLTTDTAWQDRARTDLAQELLSLQGELAGDVLSGGRAASTPEARVEAWIELRPEAFRRYEEVLDDLRNAPQVELAMLNVLAAKLRSLKTEVAAKPGTDRLRPPELTA